MVAHSYPSLGLYTVNLTISDSLGSTLKIAKPVRVFPRAPLMTGWAGVRIGESDPQQGNPPSNVFPGQSASDMELEVANLTARGFNTERVIFKNPETSGIEWPNKVAFNNTRLARATAIAQHFGIYMILNYHHDCDWVNSTYTCTDPETRLTVTDLQSKWLRFWEDNVTLPLKNSYERLVYEPLNEPLVSGTLKNGNLLPYPGTPAELADAYQRFINTVRNTVGDTEHYIVVSNANWDGDFPTVTDPQNKLLLSRHWYYFYNTGSIYGPEPIAYDLNGNHAYDSGELLLAGRFPPVGTVLQSDPRIMFYDSDGNGSWDEGEPVVYDSDLNHIYDSNDSLIAGPSIPTGLSVRVDSRIRFVDSGSGIPGTAGDGVWDSSPSCPIVNSSIINKCGYMIFDYDTRGNYLYDTSLCTYSITCARAAADSFYAYLEKAAVKYGYQVVITEVGALWHGPVYDTPPDDSTGPNSLCNYSPTSLAFVQRIIGDFSADTRLGYMLEANGDWAEGLYGCTGVWGRQLNVPPLWPSSTFRFDWADFDNDGSVDILDVAQVVHCYGSKTTASSWAGCAYWDFNTDGKVNILDIASVALVYGSRHDPFPGFGLTAYRMDPYWHSRCSLLQASEKQYCLANL